MNLNVSIVWMELTGWCKIMTPSFIISNYWQEKIVTNLSVFREVRYKDNPIRKPFWFSNKREATHREQTSLQPSLCPILWTHPHQHFLKLPCLKFEAFHTCCIEFFDTVHRALGGRRPPSFSSFPFWNFQHHSFTVGYIIHALPYTACICVWICTDQTWIYFGQQMPV